MKETKKEERKINKIPRFPLLASHYSAGGIQWRAAANSIVK
jgi:hypothetical protein